MFALSVVDCLPVSTMQLYAYDLSQGMAKMYSKGLLGKEIEGVWHSGVVIWDAGASFFVLKICVQSSQVCSFMVWAMGLLELNTISPLCAEGKNPQEFFFQSGIQRLRAGQTPFGLPLHVHDLGYTEVDDETLHALIHEMAPRFTADTYNLLTHNCNHFSNELCGFLVGCEIPDYCLKQVEEVLKTPLGSLLAPFISQMQTRLGNTGERQL